MKAIALIVGAVLVIGFIPFVMDSITDFRTSDFNEDHIVTLVAPDTSATVTLSQDLFGDATSYVDDITSNVTGDAPIASSYVAATNALTVTGLVTDSTRRLTVEYKISNLGDYPGADIGSRMWPLLLVVGIIGIIVAAVVNAARNRNE